eukprot:GHVT01095064.1.p1 GENE.GHVT01095064.1~~GHVT01095064.1.p1  ORF type:complete len:153 (+),score=9.82 GHVT01095064.1:614-1072(+)
MVGMSVKEFAPLPSQESSRNAVVLPPNVRVGPVLSDHEHSSTGVCLRYHVPHPLLYAVLLFDWSIVFKRKCSLASSNQRCDSQILPLLEGWQDVFDFFDFLQQHSAHANGLGFRIARPPDLKSTREARQHTGPHGGRKRSQPASQPATVCQC